MNVEKSVLLNFQCHYIELNSDDVVKNSATRFDKVHESSIINGKLERFITKLDSKKVSKRSIQSEFQKVFFAILDDVLLWSNFQLLPVAIRNWK